jgi:hypothetical protein
MKDEKKSQAHCKCRMPKIPHIHVDIAKFKSQGKIYNFLQLGSSFTSLELAESMIWFIIITISIIPLTKTTKTNKKNVL